MLIPISRLYVRSRILHLAQIIAVIDKHARSGYLGAPVARIVALLPTLLLLNLLHDHALASTAARGCSSVAKAPRQVLH